MKFKTTILILLFLLSVISFTYSNGKLSTINNQVADFFYSDNISLGENLTWNVVSFEREVDENWVIKQGVSVEQGDVFRIQCISDPDDLSIANYTNLFTSNETWAQFYLNEDLLGDDASQLDLYTNVGSINDINWIFLLPTLLLIDANNVSTFQHYYDFYLPYEFDNNTESFDVTLTNSLFIMHFELHEKVPLFIGGWIKIDEVYDVSYNIEWGYLDKLDLYKKAGNDLYHLILQNELSTQKVSINWYIGMIAFLIIGLVAVYIRKR